MNNIPHSAHEFAMAWTHQAIVAGAHEILGGNLQDAAYVMRLERVGDAVQEVPDFLAEWQEAMRAGRFGHAIVVGYRWARTMALLDENRLETESLNAEILVRGDDLVAVDCDDRGMTDDDYANVAAIASMGPCPFRQGNSLLPLIFGGTRAILCRFRADLLRFQYANTQFLPK